MKLSIIIVTWNTSQITINLIKSIYRYLPNSLFQIILVDNASTDDTVTQVKKLNKKNLILIQNQSNLGFSKANNIGAKQAQGKYYLFLNSDMELVDNSLLKMLNFLERKTKIGAVGPQLLNPDLTVQASAFPPQSISRAFREFWLHQKTFSKYIPSLTKSVSCFAISGGAFLIPSIVYKKLHGWDEKYYFYYEDLDFCQRLHQHHFQVFYYPHTKIIHRHGASGQKLQNSQNQWKRLIPSSIIYHGLLKHYLLFLIIRLGQKLFPHEQINN